MHLKNFSMVKSPLGWELSPFYDLLNVTLVLPEDQEELALTLEGKKRKFARSHFESFGRSLQLTNRQSSRAFERLHKNRPKADQWISNSFLSSEMKHQYREIVAERYQRLFE